MKKLLAGFGVITILVITACNNNKQNNTHDHSMNHDSMNHDSMQMDTMKGMKHEGMNHSKQTGSMTDMNDDMKSSGIYTSSTDPVVRKFINNIISEYLFIKNGLAADDKMEPKTGAAKMASSVRKFDKSFFTASQKKEFDKYADNMNDQLQGIIIAKQIEEQRALFGSLSQQVYELVKLFGANQILYYDHCPMALNNKGAMWLSETKEITNPYLGSSMLTCGTVQEIVQ
ncbi:MAG: DUF3347 domain-containing protein [Sediminibacterium magnilacihabitans]|nr:DUF3347 domain-containing protein [Sediminibacterium magnilacihabitans]PQV61859.1 uncharacterized protein DUF3347 [Sediminibacterium magnilacihabitans]